MSGVPADLDTLWDYENPAATEERFREVLTALDALPVDDTLETLNAQRLLYRCELLTQLARTLGLQRRFDEALTVLGKVESLQCMAPRCVIRYGLEKGRVFNSSGDKDKARRFFLKSWEIAVEAGEEALEVDAAHMMAIVEPPEEQLEWNEKAMATAERSADPKARKWMGSLYNNIGWTYHDMGQYDKALDLFEKALHFRVQEGKEHLIKIAQWCVARCLRSLGKLDEAWAMQNELEKAGESDGFVEEELAEILLAQGKDEEARPYFAKAHEKLSKVDWVDPERIERLKSLS